MSIPVRELLLVGGCVVTARLAFLLAILLWPVLPFHNDPLLTQYDQDHITRESELGPSGAFRVLPRRR